TDGDGFLDGEELKNGFDPLGPGEIKPEEKLSGVDLALLRGEVLEQPKTQEIDGSYLFFGLTKENELLSCNHQDCTWPNCLYLGAVSEIPAEVVPYPPPQSRMYTFWGNQADSQGIIDEPEPWFAYNLFFHVSSEPIYETFDLRMVVRADSGFFWTKKLASYAPAGEFNPTDWIFLGGRDVSDFDLTGLYVFIQKRHGCQECGWGRFSILWSKITVKEYESLDGFIRTFDGDEVGWSLADDCDDNEETVYPGAPELCDGKDNDCDEEIDEIQMGDVNQDCSVNIIDVVLVISHILEVVPLDADGQVLADLNQDGVINIIDAALIVSIILGSP
ncbi:MAG: dockerin type I domain-containing protein, partial [bacterium]